METKPKRTKRKPNNYGPLKTLDIGESITLPWLPNVSRIVKAWKFSAKKVECGYQVTRLA